MELYSTKINYYSSYTIQVTNMQPCYISLALWVYLMNIWNQEDEPWIRSQIIVLTVAAPNFFFFKVVVMKFKLYKI